MGRSEAALALALALVLLAGCAGRHSVTGYDIYPAPIPSHRFSDIVIVRGHTNEEARVAESLSRALASQHSVEVRATGAGVHGGTAGGTAGETETLFVHIELWLEERAEPTWSSVPETHCGPIGCTTRTGTRLTPVPEVDGRMRLSFHGPNGEVRLEPVALVASLRGHDFLTVRHRVVEQLARRAGALLAGRRVRVRAVLMAIPEIPRVASAIESAIAGEWVQARQTLEAIAGEIAEVGTALPEAPLARLYYDLGIARRFTRRSGEASEDHFAGVIRALQRATRSDSHPRYRAALREVERQRDEVRDLMLQRRRHERAAQTFRGSEASSMRVPEVPAAYQNATPPPEATRLTPAPVPREMVESP